MELVLGRVEKWANLHPTCLPSFLPSPEGSQASATFQNTVWKPNIWSNSAMSPIKAWPRCEVVFSVVRAERQLHSYHFSVQRREEEWTGPKHVGRFDKTLVKVQNMWTFLPPIVDDNLLGGPFPFSCLFLDCFSCHLKHFLCGSSTFYQPEDE